MIKFDEFMKQTEQVVEKGERTPFYLVKLIYFFVLVKRLNIKEVTNEIAYKIALQNWASIKIDEKELFERLETDGDGVNEYFNVSDINFEKETATVYLDKKYLERPKQVSPSI
jgi:hypothetical protein